MAEKYGRLTVVRWVGALGKRAECVCDCGGRVSQWKSRLEAGNVMSCGCLQRDTVRKMATTHRMTKSREYDSWAGMKARCTNKKHVRFHRYGGRGIKVCARWNRFENFLKDMGTRPPKTSLDRINNDKGYYPANCRWATASQQARNKSPTALFPPKRRNNPTKQSEPTSRLSTPPDTDKHPD